LRYADGGAQHETYRNGEKLK